jgi:shikimate kinase
VAGAYPSRPQTGRVRPVSLIGLPGVGKSTFGREPGDAKPPAARHAPRLCGRDFQDSDRWIEANSGVTIAEIFARDGEPGFRAVEARALAALIDAPGGGLIAVGGGAVTHPPSFELIRDRTFAIYLRAHPDLLAGRLRHDSKRPLLQGRDVFERMAELAEQREALYVSAAALVLDVGTMARRDVARRIAAEVVSMQGDARP